MARILVVADDANTADLVFEVLTSAGHTVGIAADEADATRALAGPIPDLIVLDLAMEALGSWRVLEELYRRNVRRSVRVVVMTESMDDRPSDARCAAVLLKPFVEEELLTVVRDALARHPEDLLGDADRGHTLVRLIDRVGAALR